MAGGGRGGLGWLVLIAALAVPGFLFYNWWSRLKAAHDHSLSLKVKSRLPAGGVFRAPPAADRLVNPISSATAASPAAGAGMAAPKLGPAASAAMTGAAPSPAVVPGSASTAAAP
ncbi:MAG: hypothetical protein KGM24_02510, partial [Elusimicrobia bacterium]|nr:hypothetical protein [Elusimicrobiota bacterium]